MRRHVCPAWSCAVAVVFVGLATHVCAQTSWAPNPAVAGIAPLGVLLVEDDDDEGRATVPQGRYFFGLLDGRSSYGKDFFHDPFLGPEFEAERQVETDYLHGQRHGYRDDEVDGEFQWNLVGELTVSGELGWDSARTVGVHGGATGDDDGPGSANGFENVDLAVYHPLFQFVSPGGTFDYTAVARLDVGIPTHTAASGTDAQLTPLLGQLLRLGDHVSLEAWTGPQITIGPRQSDLVIYGASLGCNLPRSGVRVPLVDAITPILELDGQTPFTGVGQDALFGVAGASVSFRSVGPAQPQLQVGYQFPIDQGARDELQWGIVTEVRVQL